MSNADEKRTEKLHRSFDLIEDEFIEEASPSNAKPLLLTQNKIIKRTALIAACACIVAATIPFLILLNKRNTIDEPIGEETVKEIPRFDEPIGEETVKEIPTFDDAQYSALDIANLFSSKGLPMGTATNSYEEVCVAQDKDLNISPIPDKEYLTVYKIKDVKKELDEKELSNFTSDILSRLYERRNMPQPTFEIKQMDFTEYSILDVNVDRGEDIHFSPMISQYSYVNSASFAFRASPTTGPFLLGDAEISMYDSTLSDEQIIANLSVLKKELFYIFDVEFKDVSVSRYYVSDREYPYSITIRFYNSIKETDNTSDSITITFKNTRSFTDISLPQVTISYDQYRDNPYEPIKNVKMIPLAKAEELLYKGYVFGGHSCPICMSSQSPVDFEGYDYVNLEYVRGYKEYSESLPFYAFYKYIGDNDKGHKIFARTYVPAIEVSGYEEYFEAQKSQHK